MSGFPKSEWGKGMTQDKSTPTDLQRMDTAPRDGTEILVWWPLMSLEDLELDAVPKEFAAGEDWGTFVVTKWEGSGWMDPPFCEVIGGYFGDDYEYAPHPLYWWPCPAKPVKPVSAEEIVYG